MTHFGDVSFKNKLEQITVQIAMRTDRVL